MLYFLLTSFGPAFFYTRPTNVFFSFIMLEDEFVSAYAFLLLPDKGFLFVSACQWWRFG
jgi:hypothetical protein